MDNYIIDKTGRFLNFVMNIVFLIPGFFNFCNEVWVFMSEFVVLHDNN